MKERGLLASGSYDNARLNIDYTEEVGCPSTFIVRITCNLINPGYLQSQVPI